MPRSTTQRGPSRDAAISYSLVASGPGATDFVPSRDAATSYSLTAELRSVNQALWDIEDEIRCCERDGEFGPKFVELARSVYKNNDRRTAIKRQINERLGSHIVEEKSYAEREVR